MLVVSGLETSKNSRKHRGYMASETGSGCFHGKSISLHSEYNKERV